MVSEWNGTATLSTDALMKKGLKLIVPWSSIPFSQELFQLMP